MGDLVIVAGAAGFIGKHLAKHLIETGMNVIALDKVPVNIPGATSKILDLTDRKVVLNTLSKVHPRWVFNLTGEIDHTITWPNQRELMNQHWLSVLNLVEALDNNHPEAFVNIGSSDEYGDQAAPQHEDIRESPIAPYSTAKVSATHYLQMWHRRTSFPTIIARFFLVYGPGQSTSRLIPWACTTLSRGERMPASPGSQIRDFLYIEDAVQALIKLANTPLAQGNIFNVASGIPISVREVLVMLQDLIGCSSIDFGAYPIREGEIMELYADISKITQVTGWRPQTGLMEGLKSTTAFYTNRIQ